MELKAETEIEKRVLEHVLANASPDLMKRIEDEGKTIRKCWEYVTSCARAKATHGQYCMTDEEAFGLVMHYFEDEPEGATYKGDEEKRERKRQKKAVVRDADERKREKERVDTPAPEEREAEGRRRKMELERLARRQAKHEAEERRRKLDEAQQTFDF